MNKKIILAIPIAGKSKRFIDEGLSIHKAFLNLNHTFVLANIINTFPKNIFQPIVICTKNQRIKYKSYFEKLSENNPELEVLIIKEHDLGPTYSLSQLKVKDDIPILVHYCDFLVRMDIKKIISGFEKNFILAPFFCGFHPASLGSTTFGYMKLDPNQFLITLKEKSSFTKDRINEPCSTGIYGFPSFRIFKLLAEQLLKNPKSWGQKEAYTSLCMNIAVEEGKKVYCQEVEKFICLGTPRDYKEYIYWEKMCRIFVQDKNDKEEFNHHIVTAAGKGSRFENYGYRVPKIFLEFQEKPLLKHAFNSLNTKKTTIVSLKKYEKLIEKITDNSKNFQKFLINKTPNGQLYTLYKYLDSQKIINKFFVSSADYKFGFSSQKFNNFLIRNDPDVIIFTSPWQEFVFESISNYGFVKSDKSGKIIEIVEKPNSNSIEVDLNSLLIGTFWFKSSEIISKIVKQNNSNEELFIARTLAKYLAEYKVYKYEADYWLSLGTPKELHLAKYWFDYFLNKKKFCD